MLKLEPGFGDSSVRSYLCTMVAPFPSRPMEPKILGDLSRGLSPSLSMEDKERWLKTKK